jgi:regulatory protein
VTLDGPRTLRDEALRLLAAREHSREELRRKLAAGRLAAAGLTEVLDALEREGLQSDDRYVEQYLRSRARKGFGPVRIRQELVQSGVSSELIRSHIDEGEEAWRTLMAEVARRKFGENPPKDYRETARRARFLEYRGFPPDQVHAFLRAGG